MQVNSKDVNRFQLVSLYFVAFFVFFSSCSATPCGFWAFNNYCQKLPKGFILENHNWVKAKERNTQCRKKHFRIYPCISGSPILEPKKCFSDFWVRIVLKNLSLILEFSFSYAVVTRKICPECFLITAFDPCISQGRFFGL